MTFSGAKALKGRSLVWLGWLLILAGFAALTGYGSIHFLDCERQIHGQVDCRQQIRWLGILPISSQRTFHEISRASTAINCNSVGRQSKYECYYSVLVVQSADGPCHIKSDYLNTKTATDTRSRINAFLDSPDEQQLVVRSYNLANILPGFLFVSFPALFLGVMLVFGGKLPTGTQEQITVL